MYVRVGAEIAKRGFRKDWIAEQLGISPSYLSKLMTAERTWTPELRSQMARLLGVDQEALFFEPENRQTDDNSQRPEDTNEALGILEAREPV